MSEFPVLHEDGNLTICRATGLKMMKGEPLDAYRVQLKRPGGAFLFLTRSEFESLGRGMAKADERI